VDACLGDESAASCCCPPTIGELAPEALLEPRPTCTASTAAAACAATFCCTAAAAAATAEGGNAAFATLAAADAFAADREVGKEVLVLGGGRSGPR
jgi:hypothetical protein